MVGDVVIKHGCLAALGNIESQDSRAKWKNLTFKSRLGEKYWRARTREMQKMYLGCKIK